MNTKSTVFLLIAALVVLGAIYYTKQKEEQNLTSAAIPEQTIPSVTSGTVERIIIDPPDQQAISLTKTDGKWYTNVERQYEADENAVNAAIKALEEPISATVVSSNPDSFGEYQVSKTSGTKVQVFEAGKPEPAVSMVVGKDGPSAFSTYVRLDDSKDVLNAKASLSMAFKRPDGWRDKQIFKFSGSSATRIEESGTSATFTVARGEDDLWQFEDEQTTEADSARVSSLANMMASLRANDFMEQTESQTLADFGLEPPRQTITISYVDKTTSPSQPTSVTLLIGNESSTPGDWYARRADKNDIFTIGSHVAESLSPDPESLKVAAPEPEPIVAPDTEETTTETDETTGAAEEPGTTATEAIERAVEETVTTASEGFTADSPDSTGTTVTEIEDGEVVEAPPAQPENPGAATSEPADQETTTPL